MGNFLRECSVGFGIFYGLSGLSKWLYELIYKVCLFNSFFYRYYIFFVFFKESCLD